VGGGAAATGGFIGNVRRSRYGILGVRYHKRLYPSASTADSLRNTTLTYTADVLPLVYVSVPEGTVPKNVFSSRAGYTSGVTTRGLGASPVGLRVNFRATTPVQPFVAGSAGILYFSDRVPDPRGKHTNFTVDFGGGVQFILTSGFTLTLGYRYHHLSNGFRGEINPGIDAHLLYLGATIIP
jgi:opacity protein-like surface antigen